MKSRKDVENFNTINNGNIYTYTPPMADFQYILEKTTEASKKSMYMKMGKLSLSLRI
jgi:hypothetical protein